MTAHNLVIVSLRDLAVKCTCGRWALTSPSFARDSDDAIRVRATIHHDEHVGRAERAEARNAKRPNVRTAP